jgi:hypothetical protein
MGTPWSEKSERELGKIAKAGPAFARTREDIIAAQRADRARMELVKRAHQSPIALVNGMHAALGLGKVAATDEDDDEDLAERASRKAQKASDRVFDSDDDEAHDEAKELHQKAARLHRNVGNDEQAEHHLRMAGEHAVQADACKYAGVSRGTLGNLAKRYERLRSAAVDIAGDSDISVQTRGSAPALFQGARVGRFAAMDDEELDSIISLGRSLTATSEPHDYEAANDAREAYWEKMRRSLNPRTAKRFTIGRGSPY